jgi:hypothetical protein
MAVTEAYRNRADDLRVDCRDRVASIKADPTLRADVKYTRIKDLNEQMRSGLAALNDESNRYNQQRVQRAGQKAWGVPASETLSHRQALASLDGVTDSRTLQRRLDQAVETGDSTLAKAIAYTAHSTPGCGDVLDSFVTAYPETKAAIEDISVAQSANGGVAGLDIVHMLAFVAPRFE